MGHFEFKEMGSICAYARIKFEKRAETKRRRSRQSSSADEASTQQQPCAKKLHKPPTVQSLHERPRNRLQKRSVTTLLLNAPQPRDLFVLEYDPYPYNTRPSEFLGVYSSINSVTAGAFNHGAYAFSREGLLDGSEYLSPEGRIKIVKQLVQQSGVVDAGVVPRDPVLTRLDIAHPGVQAPRFDSQQDVSGEVVDVKSREMLFLAVHEGPQSAFCIGLFTTKELAWGACLKDKAWLAWSDTLVEEESATAEGGMPRASARLVGNGRHAWFVRAYEVDSKDR